MAIKTKLSVEFTCGHTDVLDLAHVPAGRRRAHAFGLGKNYVCRKCFRAKGKEELEQKNRQTLLDAQTFAQEHDLDELTGTEKQIAWATRVRYEVLSEIVDSDETEAQQTQAQDVLEAAKALTHSGWWLDNCTDDDLTVDDLVELILTAESEPSQDRIETENPF
ncbi:hypothetical protein HDA30_000287 [Micrococcus cohnii]|uniref:Uncharacterized protein n=1 Tax=Micrococcus cohnii TaxID=993416 RepID=A0A7W7M2C5_9MICC|nr:hypothetical protein [Micrococcus cohnii]MBB4734779.1 hypothetical protein [Micrococcus cohnii]